MLEIELNGEFAMVQKLADLLYRWFNKQLSEDWQDKIGDALVEVMREKSRRSKLEDGLIEDGERMTPRGTVLVNGRTIIILQSWAGSVATITAAIKLLCNDQSVTTEQMEDLRQLAVERARNERYVVRGQFA